ncbi:MAG: hypothetical protein B7C24_00285 [Bacteroidetes bacterium 4572_77]|nr:MAG: hypothetical protein B7C24_00285 [Bacteroidetes bacterium 4572_77]
MRILLTSITLLVALILSTPAFSQSEKEIKKDIKKKALKDARKEAKRLKKDGFKVAPGQLPMDKQIEQVWIKRYETDNEGNKMWFITDARAVGESHSAAKMQANEVAKIAIANQIGAEVAGLIETNIANSQLNAEDAASITETVATFKSIVGSKLGRINTLFDASKTIDKNTEVFITLGYSYASAVEMSKKILREQLKEKANLQSDQLNQLLDF